MHQSRLVEPHFMLGRMDVHIHLMRVDVQIKHESRLLIGPELLLLDEPTKGLDLESRRIIARALRDHAKAGGTVIMATHDLDFAEQVADDVAMMFDGEIACMESPADFFADNVFYRA